MVKKDLVSEALSIELNYSAEQRLNDDVTFGIEIEFEDAPQRIIQQKINEMVEYTSSNWEFKEEGTVTNLLPGDYLGGIIDANEMFSGGEVISPILDGRLNDWLEIKNVCAMIENTGGVAGCRCAGHIHYGVQVLKNNPIYYRNLLHLWAAFEDVILIFCCGEHKKIRDGHMIYAPLIADSVKYKYKEFAQSSNFTIEEIIDEYALNSAINRKAINFSNLYFDYHEALGTVEIRLPNGTLNPWIWQNNISFFDALIFKSTIMDKNEMKLIHKLLDNNHNLNALNKFKLLLDMIFDDPVQKLYALRQFVDSGYNLEPGYKEFDRHIDNLYRVRV